MAKEINHNLGILFADAAGDGLTQDYFASIINKFKYEAELKGYVVTILNTTKTDRLSYLEQCKKYGLDGVLIACIHYAKEEVIELLDSMIPVVTVDEKVDRGNTISISSDNSNGIGQLVDYVASCGHSRIAYIHGDADNTVTRQRVEAFKNACKKNGIEIPEDFILSGLYRDMGKAAYFTEYLLRMAEPPTCILYSDDLTAISGLNTIKARGLEAPQDISIAGYDGIRMAMQYEPRLTTIRQRSDKIGMAAADALIDLIERPDTADRSDIVVDTDLEKGRTVG